MIGSPFSSSYLRLGGRLPGMTKGTAYILLLSLLPLYPDIKEKSISTGFRAFFFWRAETISFFFPSGGRNRRGQLFFLMHDSSLPTSLRIKDVRVEFQTCPAELVRPLPTSLTSSFREMRLKEINNFVWSPLSFLLAFLRIANMRLPSALPPLGCHTARHSKPLT